MKKLFLLFASVFVAACSGPQDTVIEKGFSILQGAYVTKVKPDNASFTKCEYLLVAERHIARCGISFGSTSLEKIGYWELENNSGEPVIYAMNGKALDALEKIGQYNEFKSGAGNRPSLDIQGLESVFNK